MILFTFLLVFIESLTDIRTFLYLFCSDSVTEHHTENEEEQSSKIMKGEKDNKKKKQEE